MKKMLAIVLALFLSLSSCGALAEAYTCTVDFELALEEIMALSGMELDEEDQVAVEMLLPLLNKLDLQATLADEQLQLGIAANGTPIVSVTGGIQGDQIVLVSDLFPSYYLTLSQEFIESALQEVAAVRPQMDPAVVQAMEKALEEAVEQTAVSLHNYIGDMETGAYVIDGENFTAKIPVNITLEEAGLLVLNLVKNLAADPEIAPLFAQLEMDLNDLDDVIAELQQEAKNNPHPCDLAFYSRPDEDGELGEEIAVTFSVSDGYDLIALSALFLDDRFTGFLVKGDSENASYEAMYEAASSGTEDDTFVIEWDGMEYEDDSYGFEFLLTNAGMTLGFDCFAQELDDGFRTEFAFSFHPIITDMIVVSTLVEEGGKITLPLTTAGKTAISLDEVFNDPYNAEERLQPLVDDMEARGLFTVLGNLVAAMPEEASGLVTQVMQMTLEQMPATPVATPAPAAAPSGSGFMDVFRTDAPPAPSATDAPSGDGFMNVIRPTASPVPTEAPTQNNGFFGKPAN